MSQFAYRPFYRRHLPHIQPPGATLFVTFRLTGSLPKPVLEAWAAEKKRLEAALARAGDERKAAQLRLEAQRGWFKRMEACLDKAESGPRWLKDARVAGMVAASIKHRDGKVYRLEAFTVMANHVHLVVTPLLVGRTVSSPGGLGRTDSSPHKPGELTVRPTNRAI